MRENGFPSGGVGFDGFTSDGKLCFVALCCGRKYLDREGALAHYGACMLGRASRE